MGLKRTKRLARTGSLKRTPFTTKLTKPLKRKTTLKTTLSKDSKEGRAWNSTLPRGSGFTRATTVLKRSSLTPAPWNEIPEEKRNELKRTSRIKADPRLIREAKAFHDAVWAMYGDKCVLCMRPHPAVHAAHIIKRSHLGKLRYADPRFARPAHWDCHAEQEANRLTFSLDIRQDAVRAYNALTKNQPVPEPTI